jgi:hypothetical protein
MSLGTPAQVLPESDRAVSGLGFEPRLVREGRHQAQPATAGSGNQGSVEALMASSMTSRMTDGKATEDTEFLDAL